MAIGNFNRIINLTLNKMDRVQYVGSMLQNVSFKPTIIRCPLRGRKPKIEINGSWATDVDLKAFNVTVQNLYLDILRDQYSSIEVEVGYEGNTKVIKGDIITMYQESPGPEGKTVIQCVYGQMQDWLDATISLTYEAGTPLVMVLEAIKQKVGMKIVMPGAMASTLNLKVKMQHSGTAREAINYLNQQFQDNKLAIVPIGHELRAICLAEGDTIGLPKELRYISAPPQENAGGDEGSFYTTITAPWMPDLKIGDQLVIPSRVYIRNYATVGNISKKQTIQVTGISFHFGTVGNINSMTVQGFLVR